MEEHISGQSNRVYVRLSIALDAAEGLEYLHSSVGKSVIVHRDIKSANILLDQDNRARISDVGLARRKDAVGAQTTAVMGTPGYIDQAYINSGDFTTGSDVFSFGVVLLELLTGQQASDQREKQKYLHQRMTACLPGGAAGVAAPEAQWDAEVAKQFARVAMDCLSNDVKARPACPEVVERLLELHKKGPARPEGKEELRECVVCWSNPRRTRLRPCCHVVYCEECADKAWGIVRNRACPICRTPQTQKYDVGEFNATYVPAPAG